MEHEGDNNNSHNWSTQNNPVKPGKMEGVTGNL